MKQKEMAEASHTLNAGPGGWFCPCCNPYGMHPRKGKPLAARLVRRNMKNQLRNNLAWGEV